MLQTRSSIQLEYILYVYWWGGGVSCMTSHWLRSVLRIGDVYPRFRITYPGSGSRIQDPTTATKEGGVPRAQKKKTNALQAGPPR